MTLIVNDLNVNVFTYEHINGQTSYKRRHLAFNNKNLILGGLLNLPRIRFFIHLSSTSPILNYMADNLKSRLHCLADSFNIRHLFIALIFIGCYTYKSLPVTDIEIKICSNFKTSC